MCEAVQYTRNGEDWRVHFTSPQARLPVVTRHGGAVLLPWGRRSQQAGQLPLGGWARLEAIHGGRWDRWFPVPVKLAVLAFLERDIEGHVRWHELPRGKWIQGLVARNHHERRVYVVTVEPEQPDAIYVRWPRILCG